MEDDEEKSRKERVNRTFDIQYRFLYDTSPISKTSNYRDYFQRLRALNMSINPVMNPNELEHFQRDVNLFMEQGYGGYKSIDDIDPKDRDYFEQYVKDAKVIQALAQEAFATARRRTNKQYEAVFEDDDMEEAGDVVYGPGGKVVGKGHHMSRGDEYHKGCNRLY
jgi:hypothetical protein